jgi:hypothetical protein
MERVRVIGSRLLGIPDGTISWEDHLKVWEAYTKKWDAVQSAERIAQRGGFYLEEIMDLLGHKPETWKVS